jgi:diaminopimelate decarboxylase
MEKKPFLTKEKIEDIVKIYPTPFHIYDEKGIRENARALQRAFSWNPGFKEFFAVKATPNPAILKILRREGFGVDCSSLAELVLAEKVGIPGNEVIFTSNNTPFVEFQKAIDLGAIINLDDLNHLPYLERHVGLPDLLCFRYNPGSLKGGNVIIGQPEESKFGLTRDQLFTAYYLARDKGVNRFGLHTMVASNELNPAYFIETAEILFNLVAGLSVDLGIHFEFVNLGGGFGIPYLPEETPLNLQELSDGIRRCYENIITANHLDPLNLYLECGRFITGPSGCLVSRVRHIKNTFKSFAGLDASMADLMRPGMYGAYHHITVLGKENDPPNRRYDVTGSLCENNDKFAIDRYLPELEVGDVVLIHDTGAHGHSMGFNYNGKLRSAELLLRESGEVVLIRRAERLADYFATLDFEAIMGLAF